MPRFINPFSDWGFKKIFGQEINKDLLIKFLNDLLEGEHHIDDLTFKDKEQVPELRDMRGIIYDIYCTTDKGEHIIVEMQNRYQPYFTDRSIYYTSRNIVNQGVKGTTSYQKGQWDYQLAPVYTVCLLNYDIGRFTPTKFRTDVALMDMKDNTVFSDKIRLIYLTLPLFKIKEENECKNDFERWIFILKNMSTFERMPFLARNAVFKKLSEIADISSLSREDRERYDESIKVMRDYYATMEGAIIQGRREGREEGREEGRREGRREGREEGIQQGMKEGMRQGMQKKNIETARLMLEDNEAIEKIMRYTGLSEQEIKAIQQ